MASLFVRDLHENVTESTLYQIFSSIGPLLSLRICREAGSNRSLGYAYVNFSEPVHANRAIGMLNFEMLEGKPMQVLRSERDPKLRKVNQANVFIKNLDKTVTNRELFMAFSQFGKVISAKIAKEHNGTSKCYGFVQFEDDQAATRSISTLNGSMVKNKILCVQRFVKQNMSEQVKHNSQNKFTNVYVKNIPNDLTDQGLREMFEKFGKIISPKIMTNSNGESLGFGFVSFENSTAATNAIANMNGHIQSNGVPLFVNRAQTKKERQTAIKTLLQQEYGHGREMTGICVGNLDDTIDDDRLRKEFQPHGKIVKATVMMKEGRSIGVGQVYFSHQEDAAKAIAALNGRIVGTKPIVVSLTDGAHSSVGQRILSGARSCRPNWLGIANSTLQTNGCLHEQTDEKRKPDMALVFRMLSPPDVTPSLSFEPILKNASPRVVDK